MVVCDIVVPLYIILMTSYMQYQISQCVLTNEQHLSAVLQTLFEVN